MLRLLTDQPHTLIQDRSLMHTIILTPIGIQLATSKLNTFYVPDSTLDTVVHMKIVGGHVFL